MSKILYFILSIPGLIIDVASILIVLIIGFIFLMAVFNWLKPHFVSTLAKYGLIKIEKDTPTDTGLYNGQSETHIADNSKPKDD